MEREVTTDRIETELVDLEAHVGRVRARQMVLLAELDTRQVATADGCRSMVEWTASRLDVAQETASALVRTSRTVRDAPEVANRLAVGAVTFDRAVELARLATAGGVLETAWRFDIAGLRREVSRTRRYTRQAEHETFDDRYLAMQPNLDQTAWRLWGLLPGADGAIVERALTRRADTFPPLPAGTRPTLGQRHADALTAIAQDSLTGTAGAATSTPLISVFVDADTADATAGETGISIDTGPRIGPEALSEAFCTGSIEPIMISAGQPAAVGRKTRVVSPTLRRAILHRDHDACTIDGCSSRYRLQAHHIVPFSQGGPTSPDNLTTLCWYHHHVVIHGMGYRINPDTPPQRRRLLSPTGNDPP